MSVSQLEHQLCKDQVFLHSLCAIPAAHCHPPIVCGVNE